MCFGGFGVKAFSIKSVKNHQRPSKLFSVFRNQKSVLPPLGLVVAIGLVIARFVGLVVAIGFVVACAIGLGVARGA